MTTSDNECDVQRTRARKAIVIGNGPTTYERHISVYAAACCGQRVARAAGLLAPPVHTGDCSRAGYSAEVYRGSRELPLTFVS